MPDRIALLLKKPEAGAPGRGKRTLKSFVIDSVIKAFNAYIPDMMSHYAVTFVRMPEEDSWIRTNGMRSSSEFVAGSRKAGIR